MWEFFFSIETQLCSSSNIFLMLIIFIFACFAKQHLLDSHSSIMSRKSQCWDTAEARPALNNGKFKKSRLLA